MWGPAALIAGSSLVGSIFGAHSASKSARDNNAIQLEIARENNKLTKEQFEKKTQIRMEDYKKAGINPILAGLDGGAIPAYGNVSGLQNTGANYAEIGNQIGNLASTLYNAKEARAIQQQSLDNQLITQQASAKHAMAQSRLTEAQAKREENVNSALEKVDLFNKDPVQIANSIYGTDKSETKTVGANILGTGFNITTSNSGKTLNRQQKQQQQKQQQQKQEKNFKDRADRTKLLQNAGHFAKSTQGLSFRK